VRHWYRYFVWLLPLSPAARAEYYRQLALMAQEGKMEFVSDLEEWAMQRVEPRVEKLVEARVEARNMKALAAVAQERDLVAQERDRAARERDRAARKLLTSTLNLARARFGTDELRGLLVGQTPAVVEAVSDALDAGASLDEIRLLLPAP